MTLDLSASHQQYTIKSATDPNKSYVVRHFIETDKWTCECPSYIWHDEGFECKHIKSIKQSLEN